MKNPQWLQDFNDFLKKLEIDADRRYKIINTMVKIFKIKKQEWKQKNSNQQKKLL